MFAITMRDPETGDNAVVELSARSQFEARDLAAKVLPFHGVVHVQQVQRQLGGVRGRDEYGND